jgi:hypothetical protein
MNSAEQLCVSGMLLCSWFYCGLGYFQFFCLKMGDD